MDQGSVPGLAAMLLAAALAATGALMGSFVLGIVAAGVALAGAVWTVLRRPRVLGVAEALATTASRSRATVDGDTGLPDRRFFDLALASRVATARRRLWPMALILIEVQPVQATGLFAVLLGLTVREADTACRVGPTTFAVILEDTSEAGAVWAAERIQIAVAKERDAETSGTHLRVAAGVASYPTHALEADHLLVAASSALTRARGHRALHRGLGAVEVARVEPR